MDVIMLSSNLFVAYGAIILSCGVVLGVIVGRHWRSRSAVPDPRSPELLQRRVALLEQEAEQMNAIVQRLLDHAEFMRELRPSRNWRAAA